jgi:hypothetical protein
MPDYKKLQRIFLLTGVLCTRVAKGGSAPALKAMEMKGGAMMVASVRDGRDVHVPIRLDKMICMLVVKGRANC